MPIYRPEDYDEVVSRIQEKLKARTIQMREPVSEETIAKFENGHKIHLPESYRIFLLRLGNGCECMLDGFCLNRLDEVKFKDLSRPFPRKEPWLWEDDKREDDIVEKEMEEVYCGEIELIDIGCGMTYNLIVSGECAGEVWNFTDVGIQPCCERQDFLGWFELWLDNQEDTDYFKDYIYE